VITVEDAALAAVSLLDIEIRDAMVAWLCPGTLDRKALSEGVQKLFCGLRKAWDKEHINPASIASQNAVQDALIRLCAMLPDELAAPALSVFASFAWWRGNGALARGALGRALRCEDESRLVL